MMRVTMLLLVAVILALVAVPAQAAPGIPIVGMDISYMSFIPVAGGEARSLPTLSAKFFKAVGPDTPTNLNEILPWAKANLQGNVPFEGDERTLIKPAGLAFTEQVKVGSISNVPIRAGFGFLGGSGWCIALKAEAFGF